MRLLSLGVTVTLLLAGELRAESSAPLSLGSLDETPRLSLRVLGGPSFYDYSLTGSGFKIALPMKMGYLWGGEVRYRFGESGFFSKARFQRISMNYSSLSGLTPASMSMTKDELRFLFGGHFFEGLGSGFWEKLGLSLGVELGTRAADLTQPNAAITSANTTSLLLQLSLPGSMGQEFSFEGILTVGFPFSHSETSQTTGNYSSGFVLEPAIGFAHKVTEVFEIGIFAIARRETLTFTGTGTRGTTSGQEAIWSFSFPVELRFNY